MLILVQGQERQKFNPQEQLSLSRRALKLHGALKFESDEDTE